MEHALDYRENYYNNPYRNPLSVGQWLMIGAGAFAVGGLGYWIYAKVKAKGNGAAAATAQDQNGNQAGNPYTWHQAA